MTSDFEQLTGSWVDCSITLSLSDSEPELLSESLELAESTPLECAASNALQDMTTVMVKELTYGLTCVGPSLITEQKVVIRSLT